ncbi:MAG: translation elongation factor-like protein [Nitrospirae bacterium]|nr:translation elongation factor-like protein [Nitrospirota bacterium]
METLAGRIIKYYGRIGVASVEVVDNLKFGDNIHIIGRTTDFEQRIDSMELKHQKVEKAAKGYIVGIKITDFVRKNDLVYKVTD